MSEYIIQHNTLVDIADAVRNMTGITAELSTAEIVEIVGNIESKTSADLTASGATVSVPAGYYASVASKSVATATQATPSVSINSSGKITATATQTAGYVVAGTKTGTKQLTTQAAQTITPSTADKTIASGRYLTGTQTIKGDANLVADNIKSGVSIFGVAGNYKGSNTSSLATVPSYWQNHIDERVNDTNIAMAAATGNRSAFLYYTDAHWTGSYQQGVNLLKYLSVNTPIKKVIFGGDIIENETDLAYVDEWREQVSQLPWHHSVAGNHDDSITDDGSANDRWGIEEAYNFLLKPEVTDDVVRGDKMYYYIDVEEEKTRYLFLDTATGEGNILNDAAQRTWLKNTLISTPARWHIVAVGHIWRVYSSGADAGWGSGAKIALDMFDEYNARTGDYATCTGKVEFCIGGHCHWDADHASDGGIPVILTECESYYSLRSGLNASSGSVTESSVNAIVADYAAGVVKVVRVGRGASRTVTLSGEVIEGYEPWMITSITRTLQTSNDTVAIEWDSNESGVTYVIYDNGVEVARKTNHTQAVIFNVPAGNHSYTVRPQKSDSEVGKYSANVTMTTVADVGFTNVIRTSTENGGSTLYNGGYGYKENTRISSSQVDTAATGWDCTGFFGMKRGDVVRFHNVEFMDMDNTGGSYKRNKFMYYDSGYAYVNESIAAKPESLPGSEWSPVYGTDGNIVQLTIPSSVVTSVVFARLIAKNIDAFSIVTVNEEINITE